MTNGIKNKILKMFAKKQRLRSVTSFFVFLEEGKTLNEPQFNLTNIFQINFNTKSQ